MQTQKGITTTTIIIIIACLVVAGFVGFFVWRGYQVKKETERLAKEAEEVAKKSEVIPLEEEISEEEKPTEEVGKDSRRLSDVKQIQVALEMYLGDKGYYPLSLERLEPTYFPKLPKDPVLNLNYSYHVEGEKPQTYTILFIQEETALQTAIPEGIKLASQDVLGADWDKDQLTNEEELKNYHTDPTNSDTDGDGYDDKTEIDTGYDPLIAAGEPKKAKEEENKLLSISECDKFENPKKREGCYAGFAVRNKDYSICEKIKDQEIKVDCFFEVGGAKNDISVCREYLKEDPNCYAWFYLSEKYRGDSSVCDNLPTSEKRDECLCNIVKYFEKDMDKCENIRKKIQDPKTREECPCIPLMF